MSKKILNIIVCYKNQDDINHYIAELKNQYKCRDIVLLIVICDETEVDLFSSDSCLEIITYGIGKNIGYMPAALEGYKYAKIIGENHYRWIVISNADITFRNKFFFSRLLEKVYSDDVWAIGPDTVVPGTYQHQNPGWKSRPGKCKMHYYRIMFSNVVTGTLFLKLSEIKRKYHKYSLIESQPVYLIHGAFFILSPKLLDKMTRMQYRAFLYAEEMFVAETVRLSGMKIFFDKSLCINHHEHSTTSILSYSNKTRHMKEAFDFIFKDFYR